MTILRQWASVPHFWQRTCGHFGSILNEIKLLTLQHNAKADCLSQTATDAYRHMGLTDPGLTEYNKEREEPTTPEATDSRRQLHATAVNLGGVVELQVPPLWRSKKLLMTRLQTLAHY